MARIRNAVHEQRPIEIASRGELIPRKRPEYNDARVARTQIAQHALELEPFVNRKLPCGR
jgi:hypothetical protein